MERSILHKRLTRIKISIFEALTLDYGLGVRFTNNTTFVILGNSLCLSFLICKMEITMVLLGKLRNTINNNNKVANTRKLLCTRHLKVFGIITAT